MGKMIDAQSIVVASVATGGHPKSPDVGTILRSVFWHSLAWRFSWACWFCYKRNLVLNDQTKLWRPLLLILNRNLRVWVFQAED